MKIFSNMSIYYPELLPGELNHTIEKKATNAFADGREVVQEI